MVLRDDISPVFSTRPTHEHEFIGIFYNLLWCPSNQDRMVEEEEEVQL
jgi:hypothetical protein